MDAEAILSLNLKLLLPYAILIPTYVLYFVVLYTIFISKYNPHFQGSFYTIFGISSIFNLICSVIYNFTIRFPQTPALTSFVQTWGIRSIFVTFLYTGIWYCYNVAHLLNFVISFNRFTVFLLKANYNAFWKKWLPLFLTICLTFPVCLVWHVPFTDVFMKPKNASDPNGLRNFAIGKPENFSWMNSSRFTIYLVTATASISLLFNFYVVVRLIKEKFTKVTATNNTQKKASKHDIQLSIYAMLIFVSDMIYCVQQYVRRASNDESFIDVMFDVQNAIADITCLTPIWYVILTNKHLRKDIVAIFFSCKSQNVILSTVRPFNSKASAATAPASAKSRRNTRKTTSAGTLFNK